MYRLFFRTLAFFAFFLFCGCQQKQPALSHPLSPDCGYYSLKTAQCLTQEKLLQKLEPYPIIFIGDHHSEDDLHNNIATLINALSQRGYTIHLANEWFTPDDAKTLNAFTHNDINETEFLEQIHWKTPYRSYPYASFRPIYEAVKNNQGYLHGINLSKPEQRRLSDQNLSGMSADERSFASSLDLEVAPHKQLVMPYMSHCHAPKKDESLQACTQRMYRVQVAWDSKMALESHKLAKALVPNEKLIIFAGSMHVENSLGIPLRFARLSDLPAVTIIPVDRNTEEVTNGLGDYLLFYDEKERDR